MSAVDCAVKRAIATCCRPACNEAGQAVPAGFVVDGKITFVFEHDVVVKVEQGDQMLLDLGNGIIRILQVKSNLVHEIIVEHVVDIMHDPPENASLW